MRKSVTKFIGNVLDPINRGWINCVVDSQKEIFLSYLTKVEHIEALEYFEQVKILEGYYKDKFAELPFMAKDNKSCYSYLVEKRLLSKPLTIILNNNTLEFRNFRCDVLADTNILNKKIYLIKFPVRVNKILPNQYFNENNGGSRFADTWFPLQAKDELYPEKYLHFGSISQGCLTVKFNPLSKSIWNTLYMSLIHSRLDDYNLGVLTIK